MKSSGKYTKEGKKMNVLFIVARYHEKSVFVLHQFRNSKDIQLIVVTTSKVEEYFQNCCSKLKKGKLKTKKLLKITIIDEQEPSVQLADKIKEVQV